MANVALKRDTKLNGEWRVQLMGEEKQEKAKARQARVDEAK